MSNTQTLLNGVLVTGAGAALQTSARQRTFQGKVVGTGAVTATIKVEVSLDGVNFIVIGTITLSGTTEAFDGFATEAPWEYVRGNVTAITGTSAAATLLMGSAP